MEGRQANVFYDDGERVSCKTGALIRQTETLVTLLTHEGKELTIPVARVVRIEVTP